MIRVIEGDCRDILPTLPDRSVHCVVTSPPYFGLRDYGVDGQIGLEPTLAEFIAEMVSVFREVRRVLRDDGTLFLNLGDSYVSGGKSAIRSRQSLHAPACDIHGKEPPDCPVIGSVYPDLCDECRGSLSSGNAGTRRRFLESFLQPAPTVHDSERPDCEASADHALLSVVPASTSFLSSQQHVELRSPASSLAVKCLLCGRSLPHSSEASSDSLDGIGDIQKLSEPLASRSLDMASSDLAYGSYTTKLLKPKDLMMVPARVALALQDDGWWLRKDIIWAKPNPMPESATDRPTSSHEHVFLLTKSEWYFYDGDAIREFRTSDEDANTFRGDCYVAGETDNGSLGKRKVVGNKRVKVPGGWDQGEGAHGTVHRAGRTEATYQTADVKAGRNARDVWTIATNPYPEAHFATFPPALAERCIKAGTSERGCCSACGAPVVRNVTKGEPDMEHRTASGADASGGYNGQSTKNHDAAGVQNASDVKRRILEGMRLKTFDWSPSCACAAPTVPCTVLDPFGGAGTTGLVADRLGRDAVMIELNPEYADIARRRVAKDAGLFADVS